MQSESNNNYTIIIVISFIVFSFFLGYSTGKSDGIKYINNHNGTFISPCFTIHSISNYGINDFIMHIPPNFYGSLDLNKFNHGIFPNDTTWVEINC